MDKMKRQILWYAGTLCALLGLLASPGFSEDKKPAKAKKEDPFAAMAKLGTPGPSHKCLEALVGNWKAKVKFWMDPSKAPQESDGVCERKWILGKRFLLEKYKGKAMNMEFEGLGLAGYDNSKKKYTSVWLDSMSTAIWTSEGTYDADKKTFTYTSEGKDPYTGQVMKSRDVIRIVSANKQVVQMFKQPPKGKEFQVLEIVYTRKK
jgi:hypothetical protein